MAFISLDWKPKDIWDFIASRWHRRSILLLVLLLCVLFLLWFFSAVDLHKISLSGLIIIIVVSGLIVGGWLYNRRLPKNVKDTVGFAVAISTDSNKDCKRLLKDFVTRLQDLLLQRRLKYPFTLIQLPEYYSEKIKTNEIARNYLRRTKCNFMIFGNARIRRVQNKENHVLDLHGIVSHELIPFETSAKFSKEFSELLPSRVYASANDDLLPIEFTADLVNIVAEYIIGIASLLSRDFEYSKTLFEDLDKKIGGWRIEIPEIKKIRNRLPRRLSETYFALIHIGYEKWRTTRNTEYLEKVEPLLKEMNRLSPDDYGTNNLRAVFHFVLRHDIGAAMTELRKCRNVNEVTWKYNVAFLLAYEGKMKLAIRKYHAAFRGDCKEHLLYDIEEFILWVLEEEPEKVQLHFCLGLINYYAKGDEISAQRDFRKFIEVADRAQFSEQIELSNQYLEKIRIKSEDI